jgi:hypothetical protein
MKGRVGFAIGPQQLDAVLIPDRSRLGHRQRFDSFGCDRAVESKVDAHRQCLAI